MNWLLNRLREPSTWRGIIWLATAFGISLKPEVWEQIAAVGMALAGLVGVVTSEKSQTVAIQLPPIELQARPDPGAGAGAGAGRLRDAALPPERGRGPGAVDDDPETGWNG